MFTATGKYSSIPPSSPHFYPTISSIQQTLHTLSNYHHCHRTRTLRLSLPLVTFYIQYDPRTHLPQIEPLLRIRHGSWIKVCPIPRAFYPTSPQLIPASSRLTFCSVKLTFSSSDDFNLSGNIAAGDSRGGLDLASKKEVSRIMKAQRVNFDEARRIFMEQKLLKNGIAADGRPMGLLPSTPFFRSVLANVS